MSNSGKFTRGFFVLVNACVICAYVSMRRCERVLRLPAARHSAEWISRRALPPPSPGPFLQQKISRFDPSAPLDGACVCACVRVCVFVCVCGCGCVYVCMIIRLEVDGCLMATASAKAKASRVQRAHLTARTARLIQAFVYVMCMYVMCVRLMYTYVK